MPPGAHTLPRQPFIRGFRHERVSKVLHRFGSLALFVVLCFVPLCLPCARADACCTTFLGNHLCTLPSVLALLYVCFQNEQVFVVLHHRDCLNSLLSALFLSRLFGCSVCNQTWCRQRSYQDCFTADNVNMPPAYYVGLTAHTGQVIPVRPISIFFENQDAQFPTKSFVCASLWV